jgi:hypothetical protein
MANPWGLLDGCGVCPLCRRVVRGDRPCDLDGAAVRPIASPADKQALIDAVWGPPLKRAELMHRLAARTRPSRARVVGSLAIGTACVALASALGVPSLTETLLVGVIGAGFGMAVERPRRPLVPSGGAALVPQPRFAVGKILPCHAVIAPGSSTECAAWALELRYDGRWGSCITLRVGASAGFDVALDGGERVQIPAGPLWIHEALPQLDELESPVFEELLRALDPTRTGETEAWPLFLFNVIGERTLQTGDRIELLGAMDREPASGPKGATYRDAPASVLVPRTAPALRLLSQPGRAFRGSSPSCHCFRRRFDGAALVARCRGAERLARFSWR